MGVTAAMLVITAAAGAYSGYEANASRRDAKAATRKAEDEANQLKADEDKNRLQATMKMQKRRGATKDRLQPNPALKLGSSGLDGKTLLGM